MTTDTPEEKAAKKRSILNILAIIGFVGAVLLVAWLSILFVRVLPSVFNSLASLSNSLHTSSEELGEIILMSSSETTTSGESVTISWNESPTEGTFTFSHGCVDGVAIEIINEAGDQPVRCDTVYTLGNVHSVTIRITSTKTEAVVVPYTIAFLRTNDTEPHLEATSTVAVATSVVTPPVPTTPVITPEPEVVVTPTAPTTPAPVTVYWSAPSYEYHSYLPVSDQNGYTDLAVRFIELGEVDSNRLVTRSSFDKNGENFFRFEVKNLGTKTSEKWDYTIKLPDGTEYERSGRTALKPNERAVITIRFMLDSRIGTERVTVTTDTKNDTAHYNDDLTWSVSVR